MYKQIVTNESEIKCPYCGMNTTVPNANGIVHACGVCNMGILVFDNNMSREFHVAEQNEEIVDIVRSIRSVWIECGRPQHENTTTTGVCGMNPYLNDYEIDDKKYADRFNKLVDVLYDLVDIFHIGSGIWYTHIFADVGWDEYKEKALELVDEFIGDSLFEEVYNNYE